ncbi:unnamed protein product [Moneuplotes crassus]|uniref:Uncharacterized protein n=1 Tax=Euplotes crassus TaxID=5936 RepID=A0AAD1X165_EUPCR|nr:unnamed protein product [Moneuplotes crassus]
MRKTPTIQKRVDKVARSIAKSCYPGFLNFDLKTHQRCSVYACSHKRKKKAGSTYTPKPQLSGSFRIPKQSVDLLPKKKIDINKANFLTLKSTDRMQYNPSLNTTINIQENVMIQKLMDKYNRKFKKIDQSDETQNSCITSPSRPLKKRKTNMEISIEKMACKERGEILEEEHRLESEKIKQNIIEQNNNINKALPRFKPIKSGIQKKNKAITNKRGSLSEEADDIIAPRLTHSPEFRRSDRFRSPKKHERKGMTPTVSEIRSKTHPKIAAKFNQQENNENAYYNQTLQSIENRESTNGIKVPHLTKLQMGNLKISKGDTTHSFFNMNSKTSYISEESMSNSQDSHSKVKIKRSKKSVVSPRFKNLSERRPEKNVTFYEDMLKQKKSKGYTSRSDLGKKKLKLTERAQQNLVESRKNNLFELFKKNKKIGSLFHTIIDGKSQPPSTSASEYAPKIDICKLRPEKISNNLDAITLDESLLSAESLRFLKMGRRKSISMTNSILKTKNLPKKITKKDLNQRNIDKKNISYDSDMSLYQEYLHLLLIKTSDKYIRDRYQSYINKINMGKQKKQSFFQRMEKDIIVREENKKEIADNMTVSSKSILSKGIQRSATKRKTMFFRNTTKIIEDSDSC